MNQMLITAQRIRWLILITIIGLLAFGYFYNMLKAWRLAVCITQRFSFPLRLTALMYHSSSGSTHDACLCYFRRKLCQR